MMRAAAFGRTARVTAAQRSTHSPDVDAQEGESLRGQVPASVAAPMALLPTLFRGTASMPGLGPLARSQRKEGGAFSQFEFQNPQGKCRERTNKPPMQLQSTSACECVRGTELSFLEAWFARRALCPALWRCRVHPDQTDDQSRRRRPRESTDTQGPGCRGRYFLAVTMNRQMPFAHYQKCCFGFCP